MLQDAGIKLSSVATDLLGVSARSMLMALVAGTTDPALLADLARGKLRKKLPELLQALTGHFGPHHRFMVSRLLADIDYFEEAGKELSQRIEELLACVWLIANSDPQSRSGPSLQLSIDAESPPSIAYRLLRFFPVRIRFRSHLRSFRG